MDFHMVLDHSSKKTSSISQHICKTATSFTRIPVVQAKKIELASAIHTFVNPSATQDEGSFVSPGKYIIVLFYKPVPLYVHLDLV